MLKKQVKALERMCGGKISGKHQGNAFIKNGSTFVTDGYKIVVVRNEIPELVEKYSLTESYRSGIDMHLAYIKRCDTVCPLPSLQFLKNTIKERGAKRYADSKENTIKVKDAHGVLHGFNAFFLIDIYEALNISKDVYAACRGSIEPIFIGSDEGFAMLCPVRCNGNTYDYEGEVKS